MEWLKVKALSSNPRIEKKKERKKRKKKKNGLGVLVHSCNPRCLEGKIGSQF
jgi:hypothetical protein